jgi:hypothetical protein
MAELSSFMEPASLGHRMPGRLRLRFPQLKGAEERLRDIQHLLSAIPGVREVELNSVSGSLLVLHDCEDATLFDAMREHAGVSIESASPKPVLADHARSASLASLLNYRQVLGTGLLLMGVIQLLRGNVATPATTAFWYALTLLSQDSDHPWTPLAPSD